MTMLSSKFEANPMLCLQVKSASFSLLSSCSNTYVTVPGKRDQFGNFFKIELLLPQGRVGFELQNELHI